MAEYPWADSVPPSYVYLLGPALQMLPSAPATILDLGCGQGKVSKLLQDSGYRVTGCDTSQSGLSIARRNSNVTFHEISAFDPHFVETVGSNFDAVLCLEVIEHVTEPLRLLRQIRRTLKPGGTLVLSTPYHGYLKNLAISLMNGWDAHFSVHSDHGHIKFFSQRTLTKLMIEAGFHLSQYRGVGRYPALWMSMILQATSPSPE